MHEIALADTIKALRAELSEAAENASGSEIEFPVAGVTIEFQVGVTRSGDGNAGVRFWVVELGASASYAAESVQRITIELDAPVDRDGRPVKVSRGMGQRP